MAELTFYKDFLIVVLLVAAAMLHTFAAACGFFIKNAKTAQILNTGLTCLNILLHIFLIGVMMYKGIALDEAVLVMLISVFFHTLLYFVYYSVNSRKREPDDGGELL